MPSILTMKNIIAGYGDVAVVHNVSIAVDKGEIVAIVGPNGSGKSTLLKCLLGFARLFQGQVFYQGRDVTGVASYRLINQGIGYVPQINNVFPNLTIPENLDMGAYHRKGKNSIKTGIREMLAIARAMMSQPQVLLLDEPLASLSPKPSSVILSKLTKIKEAGMAIIIVEQNVKKALSISKRGYVLVEGTCAMEGDSELLFSQEGSKKQYLGL